MDVEVKPPPDDPIPKEHDRTILPGPVANLCSTGVTAIRGSVSLTRTALSLPYSACRYTTLSTIEGGRYCFHTLLGSTAKDVFLRARNGRDRDAAVETMKNWSDTGNLWISNVAFFAEMGFQTVGASSGFVADSVDLAARLCDSLFGATGSSRALRSICAILLDEFRNPMMAEEQTVRKRDLVWALVVLMYLQHWSRKWDEEEDTRLGVEQVVWDIVVDNTLRTEEKGLMTGAEDENECIQPEVQMWNQVRDSIPRGATVSISTSVTKTITVDIKGGRADAAIQAPPGFELVEQRRLSSDSDIAPTTSRENIDQGTHRIVFKVEKHRQVKGRDGLVNIPPEDTPQLFDAVDSDGGPSNAPLQIQGSRVEELSPRTPSRDDSDNELRDERPPTPPPKSPRLYHGVTTQDGLSERNDTNTIPKSLRSPNLARSRPPPLSGSLASWDGRERNMVSGKENTAGPSCTGKQKKGGLRSALKRSFLLKDSGRTSYQSFLDNAKRETEHPTVPRKRSIDDRESITSATDSYSICTLRSDNANMPSPPIMVSGISLTSSTTKGQKIDDSDTKSVLGRQFHHRRTSSIPNIYTHGNGSQGSVVVAHYRSPTAYSDDETLESLRKQGSTTTMFPKGPLVDNIYRFMRFASAAYGSRFIKVCNFSSLAKFTELGLDDPHVEIRAYARHTGLQRADILLAPFVDTQGGPGAAISPAASTENFSLCHTVSIDRQSQAVVLAVRGTYDFDDILVDLACTYDDLTWRGKTYKVHKGVHSSARRILLGEDGRVMKTLRDALEENAGFGLVMCGHSLGGAVTAILGIMLAEPAATGPNFITASKRSRDAIQLPPNRPIHVFAYGPPGTMVPALRIATRGLITSIVHGHDIVPFLSLGVLHDLRAAAVAIRADATDDNNKTDGGAQAEVWRRISRDVRESILSRFRRESVTGPTPATANAANDTNDEWAFAALKTLRATMQSIKLVPPGEVLQVEVEDGGFGARRVVLRHIREVEMKFRELRLGVAQLADHFPWKYEEALALLKEGVGDFGQETA